MRHYFYYISLFTFSLILFTHGAKAQQLKLGANPTFIYPSAVLQLDSKNQGLLLPRVPDTGSISIPNTINYYTPPDGMIIYFTDSVSVTEPYGPHAGVYQRKDGGWQLLTGITSLNGSTASVQAFDTGRAGTDFNIVTNTATGVHTFNLPDADSRIRGAIDTGTQTIGGVKTIDSHYADSSGLAFAQMNASSTVNDNNTGLIGVNASGKVVRADVQRTFSYPTRQLNQVFQVSPNQDAFVSYSLKLNVTAGLLSMNSTGASLQVSLNGLSGWSTISQIFLSNSLTALSLGLNLLAGNISNTQILSGWIPKGYYVQIVTSGTVSYITGQEVTMQ